jgi:hypothetical protein
MANDALEQALHQSYAQVASLGAGMLVAAGIATLGAWSGSRREGTCCLSPPRSHGFPARRRAEA